MRLPLVRLLLTAGLVLAAAGSVRPVAAQVESREGIALQNQILELRRDLATLQQLQQKAASGGSALGGSSVPAATSPASGDMTAQLLDRVGQLEEEVRRLRGRIDEVDNARQRQGDDLSKQIGDLNFRLENGAGRAAAGTPAGAAPAAKASPPSGGSGESGTPAGSAPAVKRTPERALQEGNAALARRDYATAEADAREVLGNSKGPRTTDAQFLLAEALAGKKDYQGAAVAYDDAYTRSRTGVHAPDSLLGLANALIAINEKKAACETLDKFKAEFPRPREDLKTPIASARQRAGCR